MKKLILLIVLVFSLNSYAINTTRSICPTLDSWQFIEKINLNAIYDYEIGGVSSRQGYWFWSITRDCSPYWNFKFWNGHDEYAGLAEFWMSVEPPGPGQCVERTNSNDLYYKLVALKQEYPEIKAMPCPIEKDKK